MIAPVAQYSSEYLAEDTGPTVIATASMMIILCTVFVGLRYYARYLTSAEFGAEDMLIPFAWLAEVGLCVVGIGKSVISFDTDSLLTLQKSWWRRLVQVAMPHTLCRSILGNSHSI